MHRTLKTSVPGDAVFSVPRAMLERTAKVCAQACALLPSRGQIGRPRPESSQYLDNMQPLSGRPA
eukprot:10374057-Lingulodinium_polyedra.AAC.1